MFIGETYIFLINKYHIHNRQTAASSNPYNYNNNNHYCYIMLLSLKITIRNRLVLLYLRCIGATKRFRGGEKSTRLHHVLDTRYISFYSSIIQICIVKLLY